MKVDILAFGIAKEIFGRASIEVELPSSPTVGDLQAALETQFPRLKQLASYMVAVNNEYAGTDMELQQRDEIAIIPPVSGG
jgi:molybdopterin synthase sulfur carrier subunit